MPDRRDLRRDDGLDAALTDLGGALAWPRPAPDFASIVRTRIEAAPPIAEPAWRRWRRWASAPAGARPVRRSLLIAVALLLVAATVAAAIGLGLPGIRILFGEPPPSAQLPTGSPAVGLPIGSSIGIGVALDHLDDAVKFTGFPARLPTAPGIGRPDGVFVAGTRLTLVWASSPSLAEVEGAPGVGLLLTQFRGSMDEGYYEKLVTNGETGVESVTVLGQAGYWLSGGPHVLVYRLPGGAYVEETRRMVGDALIWRDGELTLRLETSLGLDEAIRIAESVR